MLIPALLFAVADTGAVVAPVTSACGADSMYTRVPVYVRVTVATRADTAAAPSLLLIAEAAATRVRAALGAPRDSVPPGDSLYAADVRAARGDSATRRAWSPRTDSAGLRVVARRDGSLRWTPRRVPPLPSTALLDRALADAKQAGEVLIPSDIFQADSIVFTLDYNQSFDVVGGRIRPRLNGPATLIAFTARTAGEKQAATVPGTLSVHFPDGAAYGGAEAFVRLSFVVDTNGRADVSTVHDVWPKDRPRLTGTLGDYYEQFVEAATDAVVRARFYPAEIAGCKVKQLVQLPVTYDLNRTRRPRAYP